MPPAHGPLLTAILLVGLATGLVVPGPASAQELQAIVFSLDCPQAPAVIQPLGPPGTWSCTAQLKYKSASTGASDPTQPAIVGLEFPEAPDWMNPVASRPQIVGLGGSPGNEEITFPVEIRVSLTDEAPAFQSTNLWVRSYAIQHPRPEGGLSKITTTHDQNLTVTPGFVSLYNIRLSTVSGEVRPQEILRYEIEIDNFSNGPTRFDFSLPTDETQGFRPVVPDPVLVPGRGASVTGNASAEDVNASQPASVTVPFEVYAPFYNGYVNDRGIFQLQVDTSFGPDPTIQGSSSVITAIGRAQGMYTPGPGPGLLALALVVGAALVGRRSPR